MNFRRSNRFKKDYKQLPTAIQSKVDEKLRIFGQNPRHPSLHDHRIKSQSELREFWVTAKYRVVYRLAGENCDLLRVDKHRVIDRF